MAPQNRLRRLQVPFKAHIAKERVMMDAWHSSCHSASCMLHVRDG